MPTTAMNTPILLTQFPPIIASHSSLVRWTGAGAGSASETVGGGAGRNGSAMGGGGGVRTTIGSGATTGGGGVEAAAGAGVVGRGGGAAWGCHPSGQSTDARSS